MNGKIPHMVQYQGSKRLLAAQILQYMPSRFDRLLEPFSGMAAITIAVANERRAHKYHINDINAPLVRLLRTAINAPGMLAARYAAVWNAQFDYASGHAEHFYHVRDRFNDGERTPEHMLYLLARCVKGAVRYGKNGNFNQSPDKRRHGANPKNIAANVHAISSLLKGKASFSTVDYLHIFEMAQPGDLVYMDPPYQGVSSTRDNRYISGLDFDDFAESIKMLNNKGVDYVVSYDGTCGGKGYGSDLPENLHCSKIMLNAGASTQATLLGKRNTTFEALYISEGLTDMLKKIPRQASLMECVG